MLQIQANRLNFFTHGRIAREWVPPEPDDLPNLIAWWTSTQLLGTYGDNDPVATWLDRIDSLPATQANASNRPVFKTNLYNGKPAVRFTAANSHYLSFDAATFTGDFTWFAMVYDARSAAGDSPIFGTEDFGGASAPQRSRLNYTRGATPEPLYVTTANDAGTESNRSATPVFSCPLARSMLCVLRRSGTTIKGSLNRGVYSDSFTLSGNMTISSIGRANGGYFSGDIMEVGWFSRSLSDSELEQLWAYYYSINYLPSNLLRGASDLSIYADAATLDGVADGFLSGPAVLWGNNWVGR